MTANTGEPFGAQASTAPPPVTGEGTSRQCVIRVGIPTAPAPEFCAVLETVAGDTIAPRDQNLPPTGMLERNRRAVRFVRFFMRFAGADVLPQFLAGLGSQRQQVGIVRAILSPAAMHRHVAL